MKKRSTKAVPARKYDARPDTIDFRDSLFVPTLVEVPEERTLKEYYAHFYRQAPAILDQGPDGACTGYGLAAVCHYLLQSREIHPSRKPVSPTMLYAMARRYDEWPGTDYDGSSDRGAMKGWHKHGACAESLWQKGSQIEDLTTQRAVDAAQRPLGAYFRVNHKNLVAMHSALAEVGILYASASTHAGWNDVGKDGMIAYPPTRSGGGGHAFAIVGYDADGFWIQNSWGPGWGKGGFAHVYYEDWLENGYDVWVARLGVPMRVEGAQSTGSTFGGVVTAGRSFADVRPHVISIGNDGRLRKTGTWGNTEESVGRIFTEDFPRITSGWKGTKRILLYAHGGLVPEGNAIQRVEDYLSTMLKSQIYPLAFIWRTDLWTTIKNILHDALKNRRTEGVLDAAKDFMLDRFDDTLERLGRVAGGKQIWGEMKENALRSTMHSDGGGRFVADQIRKLALGDKAVEVHVAAHSAGSIYMAPLVQLLTSQGPVDHAAIEKVTGERWAAAQGSGLGIASCTLWAPACTIDLFHAAYTRAVTNKQIAEYAQFNLSDGAEQDDNCARVYNKSLLYLVSNSFETKPRPVFKRDGTPILGMDKFVTEDKDLQKLFRMKHTRYVTAPNSVAAGQVGASRASHHGDFDDDDPTLQATLATMLGKSGVKTAFAFQRSAASLADRRRTLAI